MAEEHSQTGAVETAGQTSRTRPAIFDLPEGSAAIRYFDFRVEGQHDGRFTPVCKLAHVNAWGDCIL